MKRALFLAWMVGSLFASNTFAFDVGAASASAVADQKEAEERTKRLQATVQSIMETQEMLLRRNDQISQRLNAFADELQSLKDASSRSSGNFVTREELREYVKKLQEIDEKRVADRELILKSIKDLSRLPATVTPPATPARGTAARPTQDAAPSGQFAEYVIEPGNNLTAIIAAYNEEFQKQGLKPITLAQVREANPGLDPNVLIVGRKIRIPLPTKR
jgi:TolA-binding protein